MKDCVCCGLRDHTVRWEIDLTYACLGPKSSPNAYATSYPDVGLASDVLRLPKHVAVSSCKGLFDRARSSSSTGGSSSAAVTHNPNVSTTYDIRRSDSWDNLYHAMFKSSVSGN